MIDFPMVSSWDSTLHHLNPSNDSTDWFKGKITGKPHISWENQWFPVDFPINQSIENPKKTRGLSSDLEMPGCLAVFFGSQWGQIPGLRRVAATTSRPALGRHAAVSTGRCQWYHGTEMDVVKNGQRGKSLSMFVGRYIFDHWIGISWDGMGYTLW